MNLPMNIDSPSLMLSFAFPLTIPSTPNLRESWQARAKRTKKQRGDVRLLCPRWKYGPLLVVTLTRVARREARL